MSPALPPLLTMTIYAMLTCGCVCIAGGDMRGSAWALVATVLAILARLVAEELLLEKRLDSEPP